MEREAKFNMSLPKRKKTSVLNVRVNSIRKSGKGSERPIIPIKKGTNLFIIYQFKIQLSSSLQLDYINIQ